MSSNNWTTGTLGDVTFEEKTRLKQPTANCPIYGVDNNVGLTTSPKYVAEDLSRYKRIHPGMFAYNPMRLNIGSIGYCSKKHSSGLVSPDYIVFRCDESRLDPDYFSCFIKSTEWSDWTESSGEGSVRVRIYYRELAEMPINLPTLSEQRAIARILGALNDNIEVNRQMNKTLEAMARALFKSWFVDFDPVRAKSEGRDTGLPREISELFPSSFEDSELGRVPKGWGIGCVDDEFDLTMGQSPPGDTYNEAGEGLPFYQGRTDFGFRFPTRRVYCTAPTRLAKAGDTLISVRAPVGDINMAAEECAIGRGVAAARHKTGSRSYTFQFMQSIEPVFAQFEAEGTVFGAIGKKDFHAIECVVSPKKLILAFEAKASVLDAQIELNELETRTLTALRDTLLPRLMSGQLRVPEAEQKLAEESKA
jgi:type I restriction enzyme S subunit